MSAKLQKAVADSALAKPGWRSKGAQLRKTSAEAARAKLDAQVTEEYVERNGVRVKVTKLPPAISTGDSGMKHRAGKSPFRQYKKGTETPTPRKLRHRA
jgi:hypothetical protein